MVSLWQYFKREELGKNITEKEIQDCIHTLDKLVENSELLTKLDDNQRIELLKTAGKLSRPDREEIRKRNKDVKNNRREIVVNQEKAKKGSHWNSKCAKYGCVFSTETDISK